MWHGPAFPAFSCVPEEGTLWWQRPPDARRVFAGGPPPPVYGRIFGPFPATLLEPAGRPYRAVQPAGRHGADAADGPAFARPGASARPADRRPAADVDLEAAIKPVAEDSFRIESHADGDGREPSFQMRDDSSDDELPPVDVDFIRAVWKRYIEPGSATCEGTTLMCHDLLNKFRVNPDLLQLFEKVGVLDDVVYIYLPLTYLKSKQPLNARRPSRNKGYGFVHFASSTAAATFARLIGEVDLVGPGRGVKQMYTTPAKFQGVSSNLIELLDLENEDWRPKQGCIYVRLDPGRPLQCLGIKSARDFALEAQKRRAM